MSESPSNSSRGVLSGWLRELVKGKKGGDLPSGYETIFFASGVDTMLDMLTSLRKSLRS